MRLRRWCISQTGERLRFFWTFGTAWRAYQNLMRYAGVEGRVGLYRWDGTQWQRYAWLADRGEEKAPS